jgi:hypothetical protein
MIRVNKGYGYLFGLLLSFIIYLVGQGIFFINTIRSGAVICDVSTRRGGSIRYGGTMYMYYACFITKDGQAMKIRIGSNLPYEPEDSVGVIYKRNNPSNARVDSFKSAWLVPGLYYLVPWAIIMALVTGIYAGTKYVVISWKPFKIWLSNRN